MVYFYTSQPTEYSAPHTLVAGKDKFENDVLIKYGYRELNYMWFHADKYSSGHIYLQLNETEKDLNDVPNEVVNDCLQLCKSESIQGNKLNQCLIVYTPWHNLRKNKYMKPGEVSFKSMKVVKKLECFSRDNKALNRLMKTRVEIIDGVEELLYQAKKSKDPKFFQNYLSINKERLILEEKERKTAKKQKKKKKEEDVQEQLVIETEL
ncbi:Jlp2p NDAI_0H02850 [Naumovozyma dairenensis CBS 421]|uniref:NFACT RNA-binding domain-containing protein n=1 Tax=Naumovozyma dairenensis (strain ATCC 10597 / BCRC 20456 / CBS 421 / NBRC 0211 / NRRL Y-12639) TaxID=1071378 RepID=G0WF98_NAUDC|nr:hypothetical protein NDAI_0H02850 [Naumovozyma dairenensis CBS 421]CCD26459.1 hypothetical protein NDAI_0H02850 [Naumovozyma dairenensis CBS 421]